MPRDCCVALPCGALGLSSDCDCGISRSYLPFFLGLGPYDLIICLRTSTYFASVNFPELYSWTYEA